MKVLAQLRRFLCIVLLLAPVTAGAQDARFRVERITMQNGLSQNDVYSIMQDRHGFIWLGTRAGLEKYDGYSFRSYHYDPFDTTTISDYAVTAIAEDSAGYIWAGTFMGGLNRLDRRTGRCVRYRHDPRDPTSLRSNRITSLASDRSGGLWINTEDALIRRDARGRFTSYLGDRRRGLPEGRVTSIHIDRRGRMWATSSLSGIETSTGRQYLSRYDPARDTFTTWRIGSQHGTLKILDERPDGRLDIALTNVDAGEPMLFLFDPGSASVRYLDVAARAADRTLLMPLIVDDSGECWYATSVFDRTERSSPLPTLFCEPTIPYDSTQRAATIPPRLSPSRPILSGIPRMAFRDRSGTIWIGMEEGIVKISRIGAGFTTWLHDPNDRTTLSARRIRSVQVARDGALWVGTDFGLNRLDPARPGWRHYFAGPSSGTLPNSTVNVIYEDRDGTLLFGTNGGLAAYDARGDRFFDPFPALQPGGFMQRVWSFLRDRRGRIWIGTSADGIVRIDSAGARPRWLRHNTTDPRSILDGGVWCFLEDSRGDIWIGTNSGVCRSTPAGEGFRRYTHQPGNPRSLGGERIWAVYEDRAGDIWICSFGGGVSRYNRASDDFTTITTRNGLADNGVFGLLEDDDGIFWISTTRGLNRWDRRTNTFRLYDGRDGLQGTEFAFKAFFKTPDGTLYFGGVNGLSAFTPSALRDNPLVPPLSITGFHLFDSLAAPELFDGDTVRLAHTQNFFSLEFAALDYINPGKNRYAYMLEGVDRDWVRTGSGHRVASYTDLEPGAYTFRLRGSNNDGVWNEAGIAVTVLIDPPWHGTWWFRIGAGALLIALGVGALRMRINGIRRHERERRESALQAALESQETERQRIARDLHDGVGQMLAATRINLAHLRETIGRNETETTRTSLDRSMEILSRAADDVRAISHALGTSTLRELGLSEALGELLANIATHESTSFELVTVGMEERLPEQIEIGLFRITQELIANVLRHAGASEATLQIVREGREIRLTVEDNGIGFTVDGAHAGMGLRNIAARVTAMGGRFHYDSTPGHGTTVTVVVEIREEG